MEKPDRRRYVDVHAFRVLPDEVVSGLLDVPRHADVLGALLLRIELFFPPRFPQNPERRPVPGLLVVGKLEVEEGVLKTVRGSPFGVDPSASYDDLLLVQKLKHFRQGIVHVGDDELVEVDEHQVPEVVHVPVEAVVEGRKKPLRSNFFLRDHVQLPGQDRDAALRNVVTQHAADLRRHGVIVEGELRDAQNFVHLEKLDELKRLVVVEVDRLDADPDVRRVDRHRPGAAASRVQDRKLIGDGRK